MPRSGRTIRSGLAAGQRHLATCPRLGEGGDAATKATPAGSPEDSLTKELATLGQTDADNAERFARRFGHRLIYTPGRSLMTFNDTLG